MPVTAKGLEGIIANSTRISDVLGDIGQLIYQGYDMAWAQVGEGDIWNEGTLIIFAMDGKTGQQMWSSTAQAKLNDYVGYEDRLDRFNKVVTMMMSDFPPCVKK